MEQYQKVFKALGEGTRLKIVKLLSVQSFCVCELAAALDMLQPRISQHLKILKEAGLVSERKEAYWNYYSLETEFITKVLSEFEIFLDRPLEDLPELGNAAEKICCLDEDQRVKETKTKLKE